MKPTVDRFQILCLSGGGFLGFYTICVLAEFEREAGRLIADCFDLVAGTSVGGIIGLAIAARTPAAKIRDAFECHGPQIFSSNPPPQGWWSKKMRLTSNAMSPKYRVDALRDVVEQIIGKETKIGDLQHRVMVPSVNLTKGSPQIFKTDHHQTFKRDYRQRVVDVALATAAAPTFFPLHRIDGELFADGGLYANSPDLLALHEAEYFLARKIETISILSIGTTTSSFSFSNSEDVNLGWMGWMEDQRLPRVMIAAQQLNAEYVVKHRLQERYVRIDHQQSTAQERNLALDVASVGAIRDLKALSESSVRRELPRDEIQLMLRNVAAKPTFYGREV